MQPTAHSRQIRSIRDYCALEPDQSTPADFNHFFLGLFLRLTVNDDLFNRGGT